MGLDLLARYQPGPVALPYLCQYQGAFQEGKVLAQAYPGIAELQLGKNGLPPRLRKT